MNLHEIDVALDRLVAQLDGPDVAIVSEAPAQAAHLLQLAEAVMMQWVIAHGEQPTEAAHEGFRLLALHRQGTKGRPSFNACRETCREVAYHYNLVIADSDARADPRRLRTNLQMMAMLVRHLQLFVDGKLIDSGLGDFCCASRPIRTADGAALTN